MTIGIYSIYFELIDKIYIGQSQNIEGRFIAHKSLLKRGHYNYKLAKAFLKDSNPTYNILCECSIAELNSNEIYYINEFNSIVEGLNIMHGGDAGVPGYYSGKCHHSREELELVFNLLADPTLTKKEISSLSGISVSTIDNIISGDRHIWLHEYYPDVAKKVSENKFNRFKNAQENRFKTNAILVSPIGEEFICTNGADFARRFNLNTGHINAVLRGDEIQHKGWKLKDKEVNK